ncbi:hypothetical protein NMY22_g1904 [Coprinellus aureogranulatus]|nr:hypothetical protein NMY22_g1904 [Coprinellus aureogranulatus]
MSSLTYGSLQDAQIPPSASTLIQGFVQTSNWIWTPEHATLYPPPLAPGASQRAFRYSWTNPSPSTQAASSTTIVISADNYFELFVNGVLLHAADPKHSWESPLLFTVPVQDTPPRRVTYAVRAVNRYSDQVPTDPSPAGVRAAFRIDFSPLDSSAPALPQFFYTGGNHSWRSSHVFGNGWEQPNFDDAGWEAAKDMPIAAKSEIWGALSEPTRLYFAQSVPIRGGSLLRQAQL